MGDVGGVGEYQPLTKTQSYQMLNKQDIEYLELLPKEFCQCKSLCVIFILMSAKELLETFVDKKSPLSFIQFFEPWVFEGLEEYPIEILCYLHAFFLHLFPVCHYILAPFLHSSHSVCN